jgi:hypothetical protein
MTTLAADRLFYLLFIYLYTTSAIRYKYSLSTPVDLCHDYVTGSPKTHQKPRIELTRYGRAQQLLNYEEMIGYKIENRKLLCPAA